MAYSKGSFYHENGKQVISGVVLANASTKASGISGSAFKTITVDCTLDVALGDKERDATYIIISKAGTSKTLVLNMEIGQRITITNLGDNDIDVKGIAGDTCAVATSKKTAEFIAISGKVVKLTSNV